jgi:hypothetical protein
MRQIDLPTLSDSKSRDGRVDQKHQCYLSFLLRIWKDPDFEDQWRFSLEETQTGERVGFVSLGRLADYLAQWIKNANEEIDHPSNST